MRKFNPLTTFRYLDKIKPEGYIVFMSGETENKGITIELAEPYDRVFEIEYKGNTMVVTNNKNLTKVYMNDVGETEELERDLNRLIKDSLEDK